MTIAYILCIMYVVVKIEKRRDEMGNIEDFVREVHRVTGYTGRELMETAYFTLMLMGDFAGNK